MDPTHFQDPRDLLPRDAYFHLIHVLRAALPPGDGTPKAVALRDRAAIAQAAALCPANAAEAAVAAQFVAANLQAMDCLRLAQTPDAPREQSMRCTAQAATMMRQAQAAVRLLLRLQAVRTKREATDRATTQAAWCEHHAASWMMEAAGESLPSGQSPTVETFETIARPIDPAATPALKETDTVESHPAGLDIATDSFETIVRQDPADTAPAREKPVLRAVPADPTQPSDAPRPSQSETTPTPASWTDAWAERRASQRSKGP